jgi:hypothetical protein
LKKVNRPSPRKKIKNKYLFTSLVRILFLEFFFFSNNISTYKTGHQQNPATSCILYISLEHLHLIRTYIYIYIYIYCITLLLTLCILATYTCVQRASAYPWTSLCRERLNICIGRFFFLNISEGNNEISNIPCRAGINVRACTI